MPGRREGAVDDVGGRVIAAHRIDGDAAGSGRVGSLSHVASRRTLLLVDGTDLSPPVVSAVRTYAVRRLRFVTLRARARAGRSERVVRPALPAAALGVTSFWIRHRACSGRAP
jgi:hypothetical protein